ncbi:MAG: CBS domain-containing protein [Cyclobacteriaceae bacterium]
MKISASLYSSKERSLENLVKELDECHIDYFHIDCNDDPSVFEDIAKIRAYSSTPIDLHIISDQPNRYFDLIEKHKIELVTFQFENLPRDTQLPTFTSSSLGLAIVSDTSVDVFESYKDQFDFILIMTTTPGKSGGVFRKDNFRRIRKFRNQFPGKGIHVDGGVNDETGFILRMLGVSSVVSGSYLVNHESIGAALMHLRSSVIHSDYHVRDFMMDTENAPVIAANSNVKQIFQSIESSNMGFTLLINPDNSLFGISSNADMRRGLLKNLDDFNAISTNDIVNNNPVTVNESATISEMLQLVQSKRFLISYLPVINDKKELTGALSFINLIRSES